jgi:hypothetical protein
MQSVIVNSRDFPVCDRDEFRHSLLRESTTWPAVSAFDAQFAKNYKARALAIVDFLATKSRVNLDTFKSSSKRKSLRIV